MRREWSFLKILKEGVVTLLMLLVISLVINYFRQPQIDDNIYTFELKDINNTPIDFDAFKGQPLVVHFWATWCPTCKLEASNIQSIAHEYQLISIAVHSGSDEEISHFMKEKDLNYRVINDQNGTLANRFNIGAYPTTLIYDANGTLKFSEVGYSTTLGLKARLGLVK